MKFHLIIPLIFTFVISCESHTHSHDDEGEHLHLNDDQKWKVNPETTKGIENLMELVQTLDMESNHSEYLDLKEKLMDEVRLIFKECTMEGEAHDQLHIYLKGVIKRINKIDKGSSHQRYENLLVLEQVLYEFNTYFEL